MKKLIIIGKGPAGISAALYAVRTGMDVTVIGKDNGALVKGGMIENYYGFENGIEGNDLVNIGVKQALNLGVKVVNEEVLNVSYDGNYKVKTNEQEYEGIGLIISTGISRTAPSVKGLKDYEGKGVSYCATCDAFFYRGKNVAVLGNAEYAINEALELSHVASNVTILTNGLDMIGEVPEGINVNKEVISSLEGEMRLNSVVFENGEKLIVDGLFIAIGTAGASDLAKKLGIITDGKKIVVDENMQTNLPGLYAAGDATGGILQIAEAVYEGAKAGIEVSKFIRKTSKERGL